MSDNQEKEPFRVTSGGRRHVSHLKRSLTKKGKHSVGVARQYCGQLGKQDNCQVAVSLSLASVQGSLPIAYQLYLPKEWADDATRREKAGVPDDIAFATKPEIALAQVREAVAAGVPARVVLADAAYGDETGFRESLTELGLLYAVGIRSMTTVWPQGVSPLPAKPASGPGRSPKLLRRAPGHEPVSAKTLAMDLPSSAYQVVTWREGTNAALSNARYLRFPLITSPGAALRAQRHVTNSITTLRHQLSFHLIRGLGLCPCCASG